MRACSELHRKQQLIMWNMNVRKSRSLLLPSFRLLSLCLSAIYAGIALMRRIAFVAVGVALLAFELVLDAGDGTEFSFSSTSPALDTLGSR